MRYDTKVLFVDGSGSEVYNPITGRNEKAEPIIEEVWANVTTLGTDRHIELFGDVNQSRLVVRLLNHYEKPYTEIRINGTKYRVEMTQKLRRRHTFIVEEGA